MTGAILAVGEERHDVAGKGVGGGGLLVDAPRAEHGAVDPEALAHQRADREVGAASRL